MVLLAISLGHFHLGDRMLFLQSSLTKMYVFSKTAFVKAALQCTHAQNFLVPIDYSGGEQV